MVQVIRFLDRLVAHALRPAAHTGNAGYALPLTQHIGDTRQPPAKRWSRELGNVTYPEGGP